MATVTPPQWHWRRLLAAPHRLAFFAAASVMAGAAVWWAAAIVARARGVAWPWAVPPPIAHALLMGYGFMPLFFAGFLFTAGPRWLRLPPVPARALAWPALRSVAGWLAFVAGAHWSAPLAAAGLVLAAFGFGGVTRRFAAMLGASRVDDRWHPRLVLAGCSVGVALLALAAAGLALGLPVAARAAAHAGLWAGIAAVFVVALHRLVPFFGSAWPPLDERHPHWLLWTLVLAAGFEGMVAGAAVLWSPLPRWASGLAAGVEIPLAALLLGLALRWRRVQNLKIRLLAMLHLGFVWLGLAFALSATAHLAGATGADLNLGLAPTHALTMGFFGSTLMAMVTRVSAGHGGRAVAADALVWRLFWLLQAAIVLRIAAELWRGGALALTTAAALAWAAAVGAWAVRYGRWYGMPRADGRPG